MAQRRLCSKIFCNSAKNESIATLSPAAPTLSMDPVIHCLFEHPTIWFDRTSFTAHIYLDLNMRDDHVRQSRRERPDRRWLTRRHPDKSNPRLTGLSIQIPPGDLGVKRLLASERRKRLSRDMPFVVILAPAGIKPHLRSGS